MKEQTILQSYFQDQDVPGVTVEELQVVMVSLIEQGLMEMIEVNGMKIYRPTRLLQKIKTHVNSDPKTQS